MSAEKVRYKVQFMDSNSKTLKVIYVYAPKWKSDEAEKLAIEKLPEGFKYARVWAREKKKENIFY